MVKINETAIICKSCGAIYFGKPHPEGNLLSVNCPECGSSRTVITVKPIAMATVIEQKEIYQKASHYE